MGIKDLFNPNNITSVLHNNGIHYVLGDKQGFQEYPKSIELWAELEDGRLFRYKRWLKKSIAFIYYN